MLYENENILNDGRILKKLEEKYKPSSMKTIQSRIKNLFLNVFNSGKFSIKKMEDLERIIIYTTTQSSASSTFNTYYQVYKASINPKPEILEQYEEALKILKKDDTEKQTMRSATEEERENTITKEELIELRKEYDILAKDKTSKNYIKNNIRRLILYLYTELPPLRSQDYINTKFINQEGYNFLDIQNKELKIKSGKVENSIRDIYIHDELLEVIKETKENIKSQFLIPKVRDLNTNMKNDAFTHFVNNIFGGKKISSTKLRNIYISDMIDNKATAKQRKATAQLMGHGLNTATSIYTKYSKTLHGDSNQM
jgi:integrase